MQLEREDQVISEFIKSIGPWGQFIVIGGGYALIIYKLYLADQSPGAIPVGTRDIDSLIPRKLPKISEKNLSKQLREAGFTQVFKDLDLPATEAYIKEINGYEIEVEFLTDSSARKDKHKNVMIAGVVAQPLSYLSLSLSATIIFHTHSGDKGWVVSPGAWTFHKGLTFPRRKTPSKIYKDLYGIWYVITQLGGFSEEAIAELSLLKKRHPKWCNTFQKNLNGWLENASPLDLSQLETQEPSGTLKRLHFKNMVERLIQ